MPLVASGVFIAAIFRPEAVVPAGLFVLGGPVRRLDGLDLRGAEMTVTRRGEIASKGNGAAYLGNPLNAAV
jgi:2-keto-4-pentenoate hydratase